MVHFSNTERKELSTQNTTPSENSFQELRGNQDILRWRKTKRICHQPTQLKKKRGWRKFPNRKETIKERTLKYQEKWKNTSKNMIKNSRQSSSLCLMIQAKITTSFNMILNIHGVLCLVLHMRSWEVTTLS